MHAIQRTLAALLGCWVLAACSSPDENRYAAALPHAGAADVAAEAGAAAPGAAAPDAATGYPSVERYKEALARHILLHNAGYSFSGPLPMILPSVVVLRMSVNRQGQLTCLAVQRSRNAQASQLALAAVQRSLVLPRPRNLIGPGEHALAFSETFLFNDDFRFQLRSLAAPQPLLGE